MLNRIARLYRESLTLLEYYEHEYPGFKSFTLQLLFITTIFTIISKAIYLIAPVPYIGIQALNYSIAQVIDADLVLLFWFWMTYSLFRGYLRSRARLRCFK